MNAPAPGVLNCQKTVDRVSEHLAARKIGSAASVRGQRAVLWRAGCYSVERE